MRHAILGSVIFFAATGSLFAQNPGIEFFEKKIRPVLVEHCYECHATTSKKVRGGLLLDSRDGVRKGGFNGPSIVPGDPDKSLLIKAVRYTDPETKMPKKGKLPAAIIADLEAWVKMGAPDPRDKASGVKTAKSWDEIVTERSKWWSLQPVKKLTPPMPKNADWSKDPIDRLLLMAMEAKGLAPAAEADPRTLIRRLSLVLTGLPPTVVEIDEFANAWDAAGAKRGAVLESLVDRLLDAPHFGERWARHWMDVVRFTETHGNEWNYDVHHAWRYRDYLIRAFNDDVPYDQLVREHIAGDLLKPRWNKKENVNESIIGTAFYRFGEVNHDDCIDLRSIGYDLLDNQIDTMTKAFQAMTVACARCHDHKLDAISLKDYHGLLGILRSSRPAALTIDDPEVNAKTISKMWELKSSIQREVLDAWKKQVQQPGFFDRTLARIKDEKLSPDDPLAFVQRIYKNKDRLEDAWKEATAEYAKEAEARAKFNKGFETIADFGGSEPIVSQIVPPGWTMDGHGLRSWRTTQINFVVGSSDRAVDAVLPAGAFTHSISERLNGVIRSPILATKKKYISFEVLGDHSSAVRLVSNGCQLNYRNFRYLTKNELHWITFPIPADAENLRVYAEIMTKFDNPKFPDQLGSLGSGKDYRIPWDKAAADPRSYFGITRVVLHDEPAPPKEIVKLSPSKLLPTELTQLERRIYYALLSWSFGHYADKDDVRWIESYRRLGLLDNRADLTPKLAKLIAEYRKLESELALPRIAPGMQESGAAYEQPIFVRGDCLKPGEKTTRNYVAAVLSVQGQPALKIPKEWIDWPRRRKLEPSGRHELADAIASPSNPLTARVMVNRVWHHLFGTGLVRTVDDFGHVGELPSHPELLDYLAARFASFSPPSPRLGWEGGYGWSMKKLIRAIVLTRAFRLSHTPSAAMIEVDPENRLLARYPARRMEAEAIRDSLLATSGRLDRKLYGPSISAYREKEYADRRLFKGPLDGDGRRSIYIRVTLMEPPKFLEIFNFPGSKVCQGRRDITNTPAQALAMLNDPFVHQQAELWATRLVERKGDTTATRIDAMFRVALGRDPRKAELDRFIRFAEQVAAAHKVPSDRVLSSATPVWRDAAHAMFNLQEFITIP